jgi:hypothetical protein
VGINRRSVSRLLPVAPAGDAQGRTHGLRSRAEVGTAQWVPLLACQFCRSVPVVASPPSVMVTPAMMPAVVMAVAMDTHQIGRRIRAAQLCDWQRGSRHANRYGENRGQYNQKTLHPILLP